MLIWYLRVSTYLGIFANNPGFVPKISNFYFTNYVNQLIIRVKINIQNKFQTREIILVYLINLLWANSKTSKINALHNMWEYLAKINS